MSDKNVCPAHPDAAIIDDYHSGDMICEECGLVIGDRVIDVGAEWRTFSSNDNANSSDPNRVGAPSNPLFSGNDLSTTIGNATGTAGFDPDGVAKYKNRSTVSNADRVLMNAFREIANMADRINLPQTIVDRANNLFKQVRDGKTLKGRSHDAIVSSCVYIACRQEAVPRSFKEICAVSAVSKKKIGRCFKLILKALETSVDLITTGDFMARFCGNLSLNNAVRIAATCVAKKAVEIEIVAGRSPISVAAAAIYMASHAAGDNRSRKEIAEVAGVAEVTIQQSYKLMISRAAELFPDNFQFLTSIARLPQS
uniref:Transcription initiation factor IIB n=1 Tax=Strigamia maritima TaxID=126957 RepID=T1IL29_STRMM